MDTERYQDANYLLRKGILSADDIAVNRLSKIYRIALETMENNIFSGHYKNGNRKC